MPAGKGRRRLALAEVGSTKSVALDAARAGDPGKLWVTAERQAEGRGRRGRPWVSERGNLYASWLVLDPAPLDQMSNLPLVAALGVRNAVHRLLGSRGDGQVTVKWPNDVLVRGRKMVGILLESERLASGEMALVVGCGVNIAHVPGDTPYEVTSLVVEGGSGDVEAAFLSVADGLEAAFARFDRGRGFERIRQDWLACASGVGAPCRVNMSDRTLTGRFEALDRFGRLLLRDDDGNLSAVSAGDLFFLTRDERMAPTATTRR